MEWATGEVSFAQPSLPFPPLSFRTSPGPLSKHQTLTYCFSIFVHARDTADRQALIPGSKVSFIYEADEKGGKAKYVAVEEMAEAIMLDEGPRETGTVKVRLSASPHLGQHLTEMRGILCDDGAAKRRRLTSLDITALECRERLRIHRARAWRGGVSLPVLLPFYLFSLHSWPQSTRRLTAFRSAFFHKKSFGGYEEPYVGQSVSFVFEEGPKGAAATKVKEEEGGMPFEEAPFQEEGEREMGTVKVCLTTASLLLGTVGRPCCSYNLG